MKSLLLALALACGGHVAQGMTYEGGFYEGSSGVGVPCPDGYPALGRWRIDQDDAGRLTGNYLLCGGWAFGEDLVGVADGEKLRFVVQRGKVRVDALRNLGVIEGSVLGLGEGVTFRVEQLAGGGSTHPVPK